MEFPARVREILRVAAVKVLAGRKVDLAVVAESDRTAVMIAAGVLRVFIDNELAAGDGTGQRGIGREA